MDRTNPETRNDWIDWTCSQEIYLGFAARDLRLAGFATNFLIGATGLALMQSSRGAFSSLGDFIRDVLIAGVFGAAVYARVKLSDALIQTEGFSNALRVLPDNSPKPSGGLLTLEVRQASPLHKQILVEVVSEDGTQGSARILLGNTECKAGRIAHFRRYYEGLPPEVTQIH